MSNVAQLVSDAKQLVQTGSESQDFWRAYVCVETAILKLKLEAKIEEPWTKQKKKRMKRDELVALVRSKLGSLNLKQDPRALLHDLRDCRDSLKSLVAAYDKERLSTTS